MNLDSSSLTVVNELVLVDDVIQNDDNIHTNNNDAPMRQEDSDIFDEKQ